MHIEKTQLFAALSNETRLRCLHLLATNGELCVCELVDALQITQPSVSKALNSLKSAGLLSDRRDANWIYYRLNPDLPTWIATVLEATITDLGNCNDYLTDQNRFKRLAVRVRGAACSATEQT